MNWMLRRFYPNKFLWFIDREHKYSLARNILM